MRFENCTESIWPILNDAKNTTYQVQKVDDRKFVSVTREGRLHGLALWFDVAFNPMVYDEDEACKIQKVE